MNNNNNHKNPSVLVPRKVIENYSYQMTDQIGKGYSSKVFQGKDERTGDCVAVKVIDMKMVKNEVQSFLLKNEIQVMKKISNINCLKLLDVYQTTNNTYIITEICNNGDLKSLISKYNTLSEQAAVKILRHILNGFKELVKKTIIHRDIKPANIFIKEGIPKLADFGFSKDIEAPPCKFYYNVGTPMYMCPQSLKQNTYSYKSDIWSIGVVYYEMLYGVTPWQANTEKELGEKISHVPVSFPPHPQVSEHSKDFIRKCLAVDENKRMSTEELEQHPLIKQFQQQKQERSISQTQPESYQPQGQTHNQAPHQPTQTGKIQETYNNSAIYNRKLEENGKENNSSVHPSQAHKQLNYGPGTAQMTQKPLLPNNSQNLPEKMTVVEKRGGLVGSNTAGYINPAQNFQVKNDDNMQIEIGSQYTPKRMNLVLNKNPGQPNNFAFHLGGNNVNGNSQQQTPIPQSHTAVGGSRSVKDDFIENDQIILAQINYCRFLVRLSKLTEEFSNTRTPYLKERLQFLILKNIMIKISRLKELCNKVNSYQLASYSQYCNNESYEKFVIVINEYYFKYTSLFQEKYSNNFSLISTELTSDKKFESAFNSNYQDVEGQYYNLQQFLVQTINEMNSNIKIDLQDQSESISQQSEGSIVLLDYLVTYYQLTQLILEKFSDFQYFSVTSKIEQIAEGRPVRLTKQHFTQIRNKIFSLEITPNQQVQVY